MAIPYTGEHDPRPMEGWFGDQNVCFDYTHDLVDLFEHMYTGFERLQAAYQALDDSLAALRPGDPVLALNESATMNHGVTVAGVVAARYQQRPWGLLLSREATEGQTILRARISIALWKMIDAIDYAYPAPRTPWMPFAEIIRTDRDESGFTRISIEDTIGSTAVYSGIDAMRALASDPDQELYVQKAAILAWAGADKELPTIGKDQVVRPMLRAKTN